MKHKLIKINNISDIDTSKISVYDLNNRYVDPQGKMYCLKYDKYSKKIEIIQIMRAHRDEIGSMQVKMAHHKIKDSAPTDSIFNQAEEIETTNENSQEESKSNSYESVTRQIEGELFVKDCLKFMGTHKNRLKGIIMNIKNSNVIPKENKNENSDLEEIFRNIEIDCIQKQDDIDNYEKELSNYPRSISYYQAKLDDRARELLEYMSGDNAKQLKFIYIYEMHEAIKLFYRNLQTILKKLTAIIGEKNPEETKHVSHFEKQSLQDAKISIDTTITEIENILDQVIHVEEQMYNPDGY